MADSKSLRPLLLLGSILLLCALGISFQVAPPASSAENLPLFSNTPFWGPDIRIGNEPLGLLQATTGAGKGTRRSPDTPTFELEKNLSLAVSPLNTNLVVAGYEVYGYDDTHSRFATSGNGGLSWQEGIFDSVFFGDLETRSDSLVAFDANGTAYFAALALGGNRSGYLVFTSTDGLNWSQPSQIVVSDYSQYRYLADLAVDPRVPGSGQYAGSLYFASPYYHNASPYDQGLHMRYSRDGGVTWSNDIQVSDPGNDYNYRPSIAVASNGTVYIGFADVISGTILNPPRLFLDRSTDGGQTWGTDNMITGAAVTPIGAPDYKFHELVLAASDNCDLLRINHNPIIGVSPTSPDEVYAVWNDGRWDVTEDLCSRPNAQHSDIAFSRSTDGGTTWSTPVRVNDDPQGDGIDQWQPNMKVAPDGTIGVTWYDRRYSTNRYLYDLAYSQSTDGGLTWSPNQRVTDQSSDPAQLPDGKGIDDLGYRSDIAFGSDYVLPGWIDTRDGTREGHLYVDHGSFNSPTPGPSPTRRSTAAPSSTATETPAETPANTRTPKATHTQAASTGTPTPVSTAPATATTTPVAATPTACTLTFSDVPPDSTFYPYIHCLACLGLINGYPNGTFKPNNDVTRGQLSKIVSNAAGFTDPQPTQLFQDVPLSSTFQVYVGRLASRGYINGYPCGQPGEQCVPPNNLPYFRPNANATRGQISKIVSNAAGFADPPTGQQFQDVPVGSTYYTYTYRLVTRGVMSGYPCGSPPAGPCIPPDNLPYFRPNDNATRGQTSKIVSNTFFPDCNIPSK